MICNYSSVLFVYVSFIFCCHIGFSTKLKVLFRTQTTIIKCSDDEYLIIDDWFKFKSLNISCPNHTDLFENESPYIYNYTTILTNCNETTKMLYIDSDLTIFSSKTHENNNFTDEELKLLSNTITVENLTYSFEVKKKTSNNVIINSVSVNWTSGEKFIFYTIFKEQPIVCRMVLTYTQVIKNKNCSNEYVRYATTCYYEPLSKSPLINVNWSLISELIDNKSYLPSNWKDKGGIYHDVRLQKTSTTMSTLSNTDTPSTTTEKMTSTVHTTSTTTKTVASTHTTSTTTKTITSTAHTTSTTTETITSTVHTISTTSEAVTSTVHTTSTTTEIITSMVHITSTTTEAVTSTAHTTSTTTETITSTMHTTSKSLTKKFQKKKPTQNNSASLKNSNAKKRSSSLSFPLILLLIFFICCIIGLVLFFIFRSQRKREVDNQSLLDRINSDESNDSEMNESEISNDIQVELPEIIKPRKGGRVVNQLDPDAL